MDQPDGTATGQHSLFFGMDPNWGLIDYADGHEAERKFPLCEIKCD